MGCSSANRDSLVGNERIASLRRFAFFVLDEFTSIALSSAIEVLRIANNLCGDSVYSWQVITPDGRPVVSSNGFLLRQTTENHKSAAPQIVFVCGGANIAKHVDQKVIAVLRRMARDGIILGGLCSGTLALVRAGLVEGYKCTVHWENLPSLRETRRNIEFLEELFVIDRDRITCAGGTASIDMMLALVQAHFGRDLVAEISALLILDRVRDSRDRQRIPLAARCSLMHPEVARVAALMEANLETPLSARELAEASNLSLRQLQRMFHATLDMTPTEYYKRLRLRRGRDLLLNSQLSITKIAITCGYHSPGRFSKEYRSLYGCTPRSERHPI